MNKIYKVVWSKVKHCYVVTSELAKRQTKGCGARSLRMATVSLGVAASLLCSGAVLPVFGESVAEAGSVGVANKLIMGDGLEWNGSTTAVTITADTIDTINNNINADPRKHAYGNITYTYGSEKFNAIAERDVVSPKVVDGQLIECHDAPITVIQQYPSAMDGYDTNKDVSGYSITVNNTSDKKLYSVYGGYSKDGNVDGNTVTINNGTVTDSVSGGYSDGGKVSNNTVNLNGGTVGNGYETAYGGRSEGTAGNAGNAEYNHVNINGGTAKGNVYGGHSHSSNSPSGDVIGNTVTIAKGKVTGYGSQWIYGGYTWGKDGEGENASGKAEDNTVTIKGGTLSHDTSAAEVSGGVSNGGDAIHNIVNVENTFTDTLESVTGGEAGENGTATKNEVTVSGGTVNSDVIGGQAAGAVKENKVTVNKITVKGDVVGGFTETGAMENNEVTINGGTVEGTVYGGWTTNGIAGGDSAEKGNKVTVDGKANLYGVYGGYSQSGAASYNTVDVKDCEMTSAYGGYSYSGGEVSHNTVTMSGGDSIGLYGGENYSGAGDVTHNTAILKGGAVGLYLFGGYTNGTGKATSNKVEISGGAMTQHGYGYVLAGGRTKDGDAIDNTVTISAGEIGKWSGARNDKTTLQIAGGYVYGYGGKATGNAIDISGGTFGGAYEIDTDTGVETGELGIVVYGGYTRGTDSGIVASNNTVTISKDAVLTGAATILGGTVNLDKELDAKGSADNNTVDISGGTIGTGDKDSNIYGGLGAASASNNTVTIKGSAKLNENTNIYGGKAALYYTNYSTWETEEELTGTASNNTVNISSAVTMNHLYGGAGGTAEKNTVTISDGTVNKTVYGGYGESGAATGNTVTITGGTVNGNVWGGFSKSGDPTKNSVTISGGTFNGQGIVGGYLQNKTGYNGSANENTVTISGGTFGGNVLFVQGGYTLNADNTTNNNTINLTGTVTGLENVYFYGGGSNASNTGNELHVGGIKGGDNGVWQGKTGDIVNNKVKYVGRFDKVVLHSVKWDTKVAALEATTVEKVKTLDITNLKFYTDAAGTTQKTSFTEGESMALLKSVESDLSSVKLDYKSGDTVVTGVAITTEGVILGGATDKTETDGVNGVKLTQSVTEKVKLATDSKAISYSCEVGDVKGVTFNASTPITFSTTEVARDLTGKTFSASNTINAEGLQFKETNEAIAVSDSMTLISNATGITTRVTNETGKTVAITNYEDSQKIKYNATASGTVTSDGSAVKYTVGSVTVSSIDLSGWTGTASDLTQGNTSGWTGAGVSVAGSFTAPDIAANSSQDIVITNKSGFFTDDAIDDSIKYAVVAFSDDEANGVTLAGSQSKGVQAVSDGTNDGAKLVYAVGKKDVTGITLGTMTASTPRTMEAGYDFTGVTTINAGKLQFDKPEDVKANMTLVANATTLLEGKTVTDADHTQDFTKTATNSVALTASLKGTVETVSGAVNYTYSGTELKTINLANWNGNEATFDATGWTKGASAAIETAGLSVTVDPGVEKTVLTVSGVDLTGITVNGEAYQWKNGGDSIAETSAENGVKITAGETTGGGIKGDGNKIIYKGSSKKVTGLEVTSVDFVKDGVARPFKNDYDLTNADITVASGISVSNTEAMNPGDTMVVVDATNAIKVAGKEKQTLKDFATAPAPITVAFKDEKVDGKELTFEGTHNDTLSLNDDKNKVLYTVGDKEVNKTITFTGEVTWNDSEAYYTNDAAKYKFGATDIDATNLKVTGTTDKALIPGTSKMTLLSAEGMTAGTVTPQSEANKTASKIAVNYSDTSSGITFAATATGAVEAAANAVNYAVDEVTLKTVDLAGWNGTTAGVPDNWSAKPNSVTVNNAAAITGVPTVTLPILVAGSSMFADVSVEKTVDFDPVTQNGVTLTGTQKNTIKTARTNVANDTITYEVGKKDVKTVDIGTVEWGGEALDGSGTEYDYTGASIDHSGFGISNPEQVETNTAMILLKANETLAAMAEETKKTSYAYSPVSGVRIDGSITGTMNRSGNDVVFTATANQADKLTFTDVECFDDPSGQRYVCWCRCRYGEDQLPQYTGTGSQQQDDFGIRLW